MSASRKESPQELETQLREKALANLRKHLSINIQSPAAATEVVSSSSEKETLILSSVEGPAEQNDEKSHQKDAAKEVEESKADGSVLIQQQADVAAVAEVKSVLSSDDRFMQKKMSVVRGGEQVQVSYKVYIPQRSINGKRKLQR